MPPYYSLIFPVFNEQENIPELYNRIKSVSKHFSSSVEYIFINDGSTDLTLKILLRLRTQDKKIKIINFSRNFGHQLAVTAGIDYASGAYLAILDADLQDPPELLPKFFNKLNQGYNVVYAIRRDRKENVLMKFCYSFFYRLLRLLTNIEIPLDSGDFCVLDSKASQLLRKMPERNRFIRGLRSWIGLRQIGIEYERAERFGGTTKYSLKKLFRLAFDGIFSFSYLPLQLLSTLGFLVFSFSVLFSLAVVYIRFFTTFFVPGFATTVILIMFTSGLNLLSLGIVGEYIGRIYDEVKQRPRYIVESVIGIKSKE
ncbi:MAG: glycosyltransferase family 2 protein [Desulfobacteraceae bacterium]|jgi:dolichol-phosphate mannosyltransferase